MNWITGLSREENDDVAGKECKVYFSMRGCLKYEWGISEH